VPHPGAAPRAGLTLLSSHGGQPFLRFQVVGLKVRQQAKLAHDPADRVPLARLPRQGKLLFHEVDG
jgi:hypothetical protein